MSATATSPKPKSDPNVVLIPYKDIKVDYDFNVRKTYVDEKGQDTILPLAEDICDNGLLTPLTVRPVGKSGKFELVAGFCRFKALEKIRGMKGESDHRAPMLIDEKYEFLLTTASCLVKDIDATEAAIINITENESRQNILPWELGLKCIAISKESKMSGEALGKKFRYHRNHINLCQSIARLPAPILKDLIDGKAKPPLKKLQDLIGPKFKGETAAQTKALQLAEWASYMGDDDGNGAGSKDPKKKKPSKPSGNKVEEMLALVKEWKKADQEDYDLDTLNAYQKALEWCAGRRKKLVDTLDEGDEE